MTRRAASLAFALALALAVPLLAAACGPDPDGGAPDGASAGPDTGVSDAAVAAPDASGDPEDGAGAVDAPAPPPPAAPALADCPFPVRVPAQRTIRDEMSGRDVTARDKDTLCTLRWGALGALVYVQVRPTAVVPMWQYAYQLDGAWLCDRDGVRAATARYEGGHHLADTLTVEEGGHLFEYGNTRTRPDGFVDEPFDVLFVQRAADGAIVARDVPARCVWVAADGTVPPLDE